MNPNRSVAGASKQGALVIKCAGCDNVFRAHPREAVCLKCKRPANRPLPTLHKALGLVFFPWGWIKAVMLRASQPYAAIQAALWGTVGALIWAALYLLSRAG